MKIQKTILINKITKYITEQTKDLNKELAFLPQREAARKKIIAAKRDLAFDALLNHEAINVSITSTHYRPDLTNITIMGTIPTSRIPKSLRDSINSLSDPNETIESIKKTIIKAKQHLDLISMSAGDTVCINSNKLLDSIQPYLSM